MRRFALGLVLVAACADPPGHGIGPLRALGGAGGAAASGAAGADQEASGASGDGRAGEESGKPTGGSGAGGAGRSGTSVGGSGRGGGDTAVAGQGGGPATSSRCDYIEACRAVVAACTLVPSGQKCGAVEISTFSCGGEMGWYTADGRAFACASDPDDCSNALTAVGMHCAELANQ